jgi:hypothetical protein
MYQFIECPLQMKKLSLNKCAECEHHHGVKALILVEMLGAQGQAVFGGEREIMVSDIPELQLQLGSRAVVSERQRWLDCRYPRIIRIDTVHED